MYLDLDVTLLELEPLYCRHSQLQFYDINISDHL